MNLKRMLFTMALSAPLLTPLSARASDISFSCIGDESDDCPMAVDVTLDVEELRVSFAQRGPDGTLQRTELAWGTGFNIVSSPYRWMPVEQGGGGAPSGRYRTLNGELTKRQMAEGAVMFETRRYQTGCRLDAGTASSGDKRPVCTTVPLFPIAQDKVRIACIGPESDDCPVAVEVDLKAERLIAGLRGARKANGAYEYVELEWCGTNPNGLAVGWTPLGQHCALSGTSRPINGEFTKRQLADASIGFTTRRIEAMCQLDGTAVAGVAKPVCEKLQR